MHLDNIRDREIEKVTEADTERRLACCKDHHRGECQAAVVDGSLGAWASLCPGIPRIARRILPRTRGLGSCRYVGSLGCPQCNPFGVWRILKFGEA